MITEWQINIVNAILFVYIYIFYIDGLIILYFVHDCVFVGLIVGLECYVCFIISWVFLNDRCIYYLYVYLSIDC